LTTEGPPRGYRWYALGLLTFLNIVSYVDRNVIFGLFEPIKRDLSLTDAQLGWLGSAYVLLFSLAAFPLGVLSDLRSRRAVVAAGVALFSAFTTLGGLARSFVGLFLLRATVGVGGAGFAPGSTSLVADYFPGQRRAFAIGILSAGVPVGGALGFLAGAQLNEMYGWRVAFMAVGLPGLFLVGLAGRLIDPTRAPGSIKLRELLKRFELGLTTVIRQFEPLILFCILGGLAAWWVDQHYGADSRADVATFVTAALVGLTVNIGWWFWQIRSDRIDETPFAPSVTGAVGDVFEELRRAFKVVLRTPTLLFVFLAGAMFSFGLNGLVAWGPSFATRALGWPTAEATVQLAVPAVLAGTFGTLAGGFVADWLRKYTESSRIVATAIGMLIGGPVAFYALTVRDPVLFRWLFGIAFFFLTWYNGPLSAVIFDVVPSRISASVMGAYLMFIHVAGDAIALPLVGNLSDRFGLDQAVLLLPVVSVAGGFVILAASKYIRRDIARATLPTGEYQAVI
jgi:MFS family permease